MSDEPDLVSLLYRADWTRLSLAARVSEVRDRDLERSRSGDGAPPGPSWVSWQPRGWFSGGPRKPPWAGHEWELATGQPGTETSRFTLLVAPGRRYRWEGGDSISGSDGERGWFAVRDDDGWAGGAAGASAGRCWRSCQGR